MYAFWNLIAGNLCIVATGAMLGWTSPILPKLEKDGGPLGSPISSDESSWIGSLVALGTIPGSFAAGYLGERYHYINKFKHMHASFMI